MTKETLIKTMDHPGKTHEKYDLTKSSLKSLQANLFKYKKNYKYLERTFEQLATEANELNLHNQHNAKPATLTFKKSNE